MENAVIVVVDMVDVIGQSSEADDVSSDGDYWTQTSVLNLG